MRTQGQPDLDERSAVESGVVIPVKITCIGSHLVDTVTVRASYPKLRYSTEIFPLGYDLLLRYNSH